MYLMSCYHLINDDDEGEIPLMEGKWNTYSTI